ncbi:MAG: DUF924 family protein [Caldilineaceae bacterium]
MLPIPPPSPAATWVKRAENSGDTCSVEGELLVRVRPRKVVAQKNVPTDPEADQRGSTGVDRQPHRTYLTTGSATTWPRLVAGAPGRSGSTAACAWMLRSRPFRRHVGTGAAGALDDWAATPRGLLALVIVLDQFSRNIHRGTGAAFANDAKALALVRTATAQGV